MTSRHFLNPCAVHSRRGMKTMNRQLGAPSTSLWLGFVISSILLPLPLTSANFAGSQCVQLGHANANVCGIGTYKNGVRPGPWTIGTRKFDTKYNFLDFGYPCNSCINKPDLNRVCDPNTAYQHGTGRHIHPCVGDNLVILKVHAVKQDKDVMSGWLHFSIKLVDLLDEILAIYIQVRDEYHNAIGEFVTESKEQCEADDPDLAQPSEYQVLPCGAVGLREAEVATALFMAQPDALQNRTAGERYLSKKNIKRGVHFTWRMNEYWCNRKLRIRLE